MFSDHGAINADSMWLRVFRHFRLQKSLSTNCKGFELI